MTRIEGKAVNAVQFMITQFDWAMQEIVVVITDAFEFVLHEVDLLYTRWRK